LVAMPKGPFILLASASQRDPFLSIHGFVRISPLLREVVSPFETDESILEGRQMSYKLIKKD